MNSNNLGYLFAAYSIIWLVVFGYIFTLILREKALRKEIAALKESGYPTGGSRGINVEPLKGKSASDTNVTVETKINVSRKE